ncbi:uncharacterized protein LOC112639589 [Camponotus floridanus]|uniref:uncharacterized protein LOC112639589 n=1 Tax=Camponotus floridanus TaxID=104421 RepID=UPI000DC69B7F|nr:uncharacterized protein LOC112639589 [Camponotus floridanus]
MSCEFWERYRDVIEAVDELRPGFWTALADEAQRMREARTTTRVREFPAQREAGIQAVVETREASTEPVGAAHEVAIQTTPLKVEPDSTSTEDWDAPSPGSPWDSPQGSRLSSASDKWPNLPPNHRHRASRIRPRGAGIVAPAPIWPEIAPERRGEFIASAAAHRG